MLEQEEKRIIVKVAINYFQEGKWDRALEEYKKLVALDPMDFLVHNMMAEIYARKGENELAVSEFHKSANLLRATNNIEKAVQAYLHIIRLSPGNSEAKSKLDETINIRLMEVEEIIRRGEFKTALDMCEKIAFKLPDHERLNKKIAEIEEKLSAQEKSLPVEKEQAGSAGKKTEAHASGRELPREKAEMLKNEEVVANLLSMAEHYENRESYEEAVEAYITVLRFQPDNIKAQTKLRQLYRQITQKNTPPEATAEKTEKPDISKNIAAPLDSSDSANTGERIQTVELEKMRMQAEERLRMAVQDRRERERLQTSVGQPEPQVRAASGEASETKEENIQILLTQAQMYIQQNLLVEAMRLAQNILELDPQNREVRNILVQIYEKKRL